MIKNNSTKIMTIKGIPTKVYPFSTKKHAHDIEFRYNRVKNEICAYEYGEVEMDRDTYYKLLQLEIQLSELIGIVQWRTNGNVCWLTGKEYGLAKECVLWAENSRGRCSL